MHSRENKNCDNATERKRDFHNKKYNTTNVKSFLYISEEKLMGGRIDCVFTN